MASAELDAITGPRYSKRAADAPAVARPPQARAARKLGLRAALTGLALLTVIVTAILIRLTWFYAARRKVAVVVGQLNRQIVGSVQQEVRGTLNDAWSVQEAVQSIFLQEAIKPTDEAKREFIFLALVRSHPTLSWIALGFPDGACFGTLKTGDDEIDMVEVKRDPETGIRQPCSTPMAWRCWLRSAAGTVGAQLRHQEPADGDGVTVLVQAPDGRMLGAAELLGSG